MHWELYRQFNKQCYCQCNRHCNRLPQPLRSMKTNTRTGWLGGTDNSSRSDFFLEINLLLYTKYYTRCQARWREGRRQVDCLLIIELPIEFPMHLLIAFGCLVEAFWMSSSCLFATFWNSFGTFWTPWAVLFGPRDDSWPISGPGCKKLRKKYNLVAILLPPEFPI